jgi:hypothetical protein
MRCGPEALVEPSGLWAECFVVTRGGFTAPKVLFSLRQHNTHHIILPPPAIIRLPYRSSILSPRTLALALLFDSDSDRASTQSPLLQKVTSKEGYSHHSISSVPTSELLSCYQQGVRSLHHREFVVLLGGTHLTTRRIVRVQRLLNCAAQRLVL